MTTEARYEKSKEDDETANMFERSMTLSSELSDAQLKAKLSVQTFFPKFQPTPSMLPDSNLATKSEETQVETVIKPKAVQPQKFQTLDEIFLELDEQKDKKMPVSAMKKEKKEKTYDSDDSSTEGSPRGSIMNRRKTISWRYSRTPSPVPPATGRKSRGSSPVPTASSRRVSRTPSPVPRSMSEPIKLASRSSTPGLNMTLEGSPPPLPYNIKTKKRNARRIQSIHHMTELSGVGSSVPSSSDPEKSEEERSPVKPVSPSAQGPPLISVNSATDPGTTSDSGSSWRRSANDPVSADDNSSTTPSLLSKSKTMLVPCRINENSIIDLSMLPKPFTPKDQLRLAMLLSTQEAKYGFNMFDALIPGDNEEITRLMSMGIRYEDAVLIIFEKRYVTKPHEGLRSSPVPIPEYKPHTLASIPTPAAAQLSEELARSMSPKPRPQSMPLTSSRSPRDYYHNNNDDNHSLGYSRESSRTPPPHRHHSLGSGPGSVNQQYYNSSYGGGPPPPPNGENGFAGDYGLSQHQYPGYVTLRPGSIGNSAVNSRSHSRSHSPHPGHDHHHSSYYRYPASSLETSRTITPNPPFAHLNQPPPLTSLHGQPSYSQYSSRNSRNPSPHNHSGMHSRSYSPLPNSHPMTDHLPPKSYSFSNGNSRSHSPHVYRSSHQDHQYYGSPSPNPAANGMNNGTSGIIPPPISISNSSPKFASPKHMNSSGNSSTNSSPQNKGPMSPMNNNNTVIAPIPKNPGRGGSLSPASYAVPAANVVRVDSNHQSPNNNSNSNNNTSNNQIPVSRGIPIPMIGRVTSPRSNRDVLL